MANGLTNNMARMPAPLVGGTTVSNGRSAAFTCFGRGVVFGLFALFLTAIFSGSLIALVRFAAHSELHDYILLIPFISGYLVWLRRKKLVVEPHSSPWLALTSVSVALLGLGAYWHASRAGFHFTVCDRLTITTAAYLGLLLGGAFLVWGAAVLRSIAFPVVLVFLVVPMPSFLTDRIETFFQYASADAAYLMFKSSLTPVLRDGLVFRLPGIMPIEVAKECSGIRSTLVLLITSLLAGNLFLKSPWRRAMLVLVVIPLAIVRNGFRIFTIAMLCMRIGPWMIDSPIHHKGGPIFFALSLVPFFLFLLWLRRPERSRPGVVPEPSKA